MMSGTLGVLRSQHVFFEQFLIGGVQLGGGVVLINVFVDQVDAHSQVVLGQHFEFVVSLQRRRVIVDEAIRVERVFYELQVEWNVREGVAVFDPAY